MNYRDWYTDTVDVWRVTPREDGGLTHNEREQVLSGIPCRMYQKDARKISMSQTAASADGDDWMQCDNGVDIRPGDELIIHRGAELGENRADIRAFASEPNYYFEPFGAAMPGLAHQEIRLLQQERVK